MILQLPLACVFVVISTIYSELLVVRAASTNQRRIEEIVPSKIQWNPRHRSLQLFPTCTNYEYVAKIRDDLRMSYVVSTDRISIELRYDGGDDTWIGLGINPNGSGKMVGMESWVALPSLANKPVIYFHSNKELSGARFGTNQTLQNGSITQGSGQTIMRLQKFLNDGPVNTPVNGNGENVFIWAIGNENTFGDHRNAGAFRITLVPCNEPETVEISVVCGWFGFSLFCPLSQCGMIGRLFGFCN
jgi:hypothetical protein